MRLGLSAIIVCLSSAASAEIHTNNTAGISIDIPSVWKLDVKGEVMTGRSADDTVGLMFWERAVAGKKADLMVALLGPTPTNKGIIVFAAVEHAKAEPHKVELMNIFASLKPAK